jgi:hypothetical protein
VHMHVPVKLANEVIATESSTPGAYGLPAVNPERTSSAYQQIVVQPVLNHYIAIHRDHTIMLAHCQRL